MTVMAGAAGVPHALNAVPTAAAVAVLCVLAAGEIVAVPGALIGAGRPPLAVAVPVAAAVIGGDQLCVMFQAIRQM